MFKNNWTNWIDIGYGLTKICMKKAISILNRTKI